MTKQQPPAELLAKWQAEAKEKYPMPSPPLSQHITRALRNAYLAACRKRWEDDNWISVEDVVTDDEIKEVWGYANFGDVEKRTVIIETLEHYIMGYESGKTAYSIVSELGLLKGKSLTEKGLKYIKAAYYLQPPKAQQDGAE